MRREELFKRLEQAYSPIEPGQEVEIGLFTPGDALGVSLVYLEIYGRDFPLDLVYDPEEIIRRNQGDSQHMVVARTSRGEIVGIMGLFRNEAHPTVFEIGQLNVLEHYRRKHLASRLTKVLLGEVARKVGAPVLFGEGVCNHPVSQRMAMDEGFVPTGLEVECMPASAYQGEPERNVSLLLLFRLSARLDGTCLLPALYHKVVAETCETLGMDCRFSRNGTVSGATESSVIVTSGGDLVQLSVAHAGQDLSRVVEKAMALASGRGVMQVYLNLGDAGAVEAAQLLRELGFFYGGFLPGWFDKAGLLLQKAWREPDWEAMKLYGKTAQDLRDFIRADCESVMKGRG